MRILRSAAIVASFIITASSLAQTPLGTGFTYQGRLNQSGQPLNGAADLQFDLYDADIGGNLIGTQTLAGVNVVSGLFSVELNGGGEFGGSAFVGDKRWLEITVDGTALTPRQELTATPFAQLSAGIRLPFAGGVAYEGSAFKVTNSQDYFFPALHGDATGALGTGVMGEAVSGTGVVGTGNVGVSGYSNNASGFGVYGYNDAGTGIFAYSNSGRGLHAYSSAGNAIYALRYSGSGVDISAFGTPTILADSVNGNGVMGVVSTPSGAGLIGIGPNGYGVYATSTNGYPIYGYDVLSGVNYSSFARPSVLGESLSRTGVMGISAAPLNAGVLGYNPNGYGMYAQSGSGFGLHAYSGTNSAIRAVYNNFSGVDMSIFSKPAILGESNIGNGVMGTVSSGGAGVVGYSPNAIGVYGYSLNNTGVYGYSNAHVAVQGVSDNGFGLYANATNNAIAIYGLSSAGTGTRRTVLARNNSNSGIGVFGWVPSTTGLTYGVIGQCDSPAGWAVYANGDMGGSGLKAFVIDHPFDPENKTLRHYCAEGPEPQNIYNGVATTDASGFATVSLPSYFEEINRDFRYQLTVIDGGDDFVMAKVASEIQDNRFRIRTNRPNVKVSWEVKGVRNDRYVRTRGFGVEVDKPAEVRGTYLQPSLYGQPAEKGQFHLSDDVHPTPPLTPDVAGAE